MRVTSNLDVLLSRWMIEAACQRCRSSLTTTALTWTTCLPLCCPWPKMWTGTMSRAASTTLHRWVAPHGEQLSGSLLCRSLLPKPPGWGGCVCRQIQLQQAPPDANKALLHALACHHAKQRLPCLTWYA